MAQTLINNLSYSTLDATKLSGNLPSISGASLTGISAGIQVADQWRLSGNSLGDKDPITVWEKVDSTYNGTLGTGMSVSSGIFTFPQTGIWKVEFFGWLTRTQADDQVHFTLKNASNNDLVHVRGQVSNADYNSVVSFSVLLDITDVSNNNNKIKLVMSNSGASDGVASAKLHGDSTQNQSAFTFTRLGDT